MVESEQLAFIGTGRIALDREIDAHAAHAMIEIRTMVAEAVEFINRSTGQRLFHQKQQIQAAMVECGVHPSRYLVDEPI